MQREERGVESELNTPSGSLVEGATGLASRQLICESLLLKQLCASVHTLCWCGSGRGCTGAVLSPICTLISLPKHLLKAWRIDSIYVWNSQGHQQVKQGPHRGPLRSRISLAGSKRMTSSVQLLQVPIAVVMMEKNMQSTLLALSIQLSHKSGIC